MSKVLTDEEVQAEIATLSKSEDVKLARAELRAKYRERQKLYSLRRLAKRGAELRKGGKTISDFHVKDDEDEMLLATISDE